MSAVESAATGELSFSWVKIIPVLLYPNFGANRLSRPVGLPGRMLSYTKFHREAGNNESLVLYGLPKRSANRQAWPVRNVRIGSRDSGENQE